MAIVKCGKCGKAISDKIPKCPHCNHMSGAGSPSTEIKDKGGERVAVDTSATDSKISYSQKKCPYCAEDILSEAKKCKHCGEYIESNSSQHILTSKDGIKASATNEVRPVVTRSLIIACVSIALVAATGYGFYKYRAYKERKTYLLHTEQCLQAIDAADLSIGKAGVLPEKVMEYYVFLSMKALDSGINPANLSMEDYPIGDPANTNKMITESLLLAEQQIGSINIRTQGCEAKYQKLLELYSSAEAISKHAMDRRGAMGIWTNTSHELLTNYLALLKENEPL